MGFFDLNVPVTASLWSPTAGSSSGAGMSKKAKAKQRANAAAQSVSQEAEPSQIDPLDRISAAQKEELESRIKDLRDRK